MSNSTFRVAFSDDFLRAGGALTYPAYDWSPLAGDPDIELSYLGATPADIQAGQLADLDALILSWPAITPASFGDDNRLVLIARSGEGFDNVDLEAAIRERRHEMRNRYEGGDLVVQSLQNLGVKQVFSVSGGPLNSTYHAAANNGLPILHTRHETAAGFMAEAVSRTTGTPGVAVVTLGPAVTNTVTAAFMALRSALATREKPRSLTRAVESRWQLGGSGVWSHQLISSTTRSSSQPVWQMPPATPCCALPLKWMCLPVAGKER